MVVNSSGGSRMLNSKILLQHSAVIFTLPIVHALELTWWENNRRWVFLALTLRKWWRITRGVNRRRENIPFEHLLRLCISVHVSQLSCIIQNGSRPFRSQLNGSLIRLKRFLPTICWKVGNNLDECRSQATAKARLMIIYLTKFCQQNSHIVMEVRVSWLETHCSLQGGHGHVELPLIFQNAGQAHHGITIFRV